MTTGAREKYIERMQLGIIDETDARRVFAMLAEWETMLPALRASVAIVSKLKDAKHFDMFPSSITGNASLATNRFKYAWTEFQLGNTSGAALDIFVSKGTPRSGTTSVDYALNMVENVNDGTGVQAYGVDIDGTDYPGGVALKAIQGNPVVMMFAIRDSSGKARYVFQAGNEHDGTCTA